MRIAVHEQKKRRERHIVGYTDFPWLFWRPGVPDGGLGPVLQGLPENLYTGRIPERRKSTKSAIHYYARVAPAGAGP